MFEAVRVLVLLIHHFTWMQTLNSMSVRHGLLPNAQVARNPPWFVASLMQK
jgi:hypothetical protein